MCLVYPGVYSEHVKTVNGGTGESGRITFKASGVVTMQGFEVRHPYVTIDGFDITGFTTRYQGFITIYHSGDYCTILNNTIRDGIANVYGIYLYNSTVGGAADHANVRSNTLTRLAGTFLTLNGTQHLIEQNTFSHQNNMDFIRAFGANIVIRRNVFWQPGSTSAGGNHPDFIQTFGNSDTEARDYLIEENFIGGFGGDLVTQFAQLNNGDGEIDGDIRVNVKNFTFRRNVVVGLSMNGNMGIPGLTLDHNTFYRLGYAASGLIFSGMTTRSDSSHATLTSNVFLAGGSSSSVSNGTAGFYAMDGAGISREAIDIFVMGDPAGTLSPTTEAIYAGLQAKGYHLWGVLTNKARALTTIAQFEFDPAYDVYKQATYDQLIATVTLDTRIRATFVADYNYVAGSASADYPAKRSSGCIPGATATLYNFCEPHGINGGDPLLRDIANVLGPDGVPFTLDDGLKPLPTSPLCGRGAGGTDIGAYSCDPNKVFPGQLKAPANLMIR